MAKILSEIAKYTLVAIAASGITFAAMKWNPKIETSVNQLDATGNGRKDYVIYDANAGKSFAFLQRKDGTFEIANVIEEDGIPFYRTTKGVYDSWGGYFPGN